MSPRATPRLRADVPILVLKRAGTDRAVTVGFGSYFKAAERFDRPKGGRSGRGSNLGELGNQKQRIISGPMWTRGRGHAADEKIL